MVRSMRTEIQMICDTEEICWRCSCQISKDNTSMLEVDCQYTKIKVTRVRKIIICEILS